MDAGKEFSVKEVIRGLKKQKKTIQGVTFSGGEPFLQAEELAQVALAARQLGWNVATYTGFTYEELLDLGSKGRLGSNDSGVNSLLFATDILIDGRYVREERDASLPFRGSANQRIIDVAETRKCGRIVTIPY